MLSKRAVEAWSILIVSIVSSFGRWPSLWYSVKLFYFTFGNQKLSQLLVNYTAKAKPRIGLFKFLKVLQTGYESNATEKNFFKALAFWKTFIVQSLSMTSESLRISIHRPALFFVLEFINSNN